MNKSKTYDAVNFFKTNWLSISLTFLFWAFFIWIAAQIPYTHDDWDWGIDLGMQHFLTADINSRYTGNLFEIILTRSVILKNIIMGTIMFLIPTTGAVFAVGKRKRGEPIYLETVLFFVCAIIILSASSDLWRQTFGWAAGFSNYIVSVFFIELYLIFCSSLFDRNFDRHCGIIKAVLLFIFCTALQLFLENLTIYLLFCALVFLIADWIKNKKPSLRFISMFLGTAVGFIIMFSSNIYGTLFSTGKAYDGYRALSFKMSDGIPAVIYKLSKLFCFNFASNIWCNNTIISLIVFFVLFLFLVKNRGRISTFWFGFLTAPHVCVFILLFINSMNYLHFSSLHITHYFEAGLNTLMFLLGAAEVIILTRNNKRLLFKFLWLWISPVLVLLPLSAVESYDYGSRNFTTSNTFLVLFILTLLTEILKDFTKSNLKIIIADLLVVLAILSVHYVYIYRSIGSDNAQHLNLIQDAVETGKTEITIPKFSHDEYLWEANPNSPWRYEYYKTFFGIPENVTVIFSKEEN